MFLIYCYRILKLIRRLLPLFVLTIVAYVFLVCLGKFTSPYKNIRYLTAQKGDPDSSKGNVNFDRKIKIGIVTCAYLNESRGTVVPKTLALIKSVLISAKIYHVKEVEFYLFSDSHGLETYLRDKMQQFNRAIGNHVKIKANYFGVVKGLPPSTGKFYLRVGGFMCSFVRVFFPDSLPNSVDKILYLDADIVITGNIQKIWDTFSEPMHDKKLLAGMVPNMEKEMNNYASLEMDIFSKAPHVPPKGVNIGVWFMNLGAMREYNWTSKLNNAFGAYNMRMQFLTVQQIVNVMFHRDLERLKLFPCQLNFQHIHCERGWTCKSAVGDPEGVQVFHGAGGKFREEKRNGSHYALYRIFQDFDLANHEKAIEKVVKPIKGFYSTGNNATSCFDKLGPQLFKSLTSYLTARGTIDIG